MKFTFKTLLFLFVAFAMVGMVTSCSEDDDDISNGGTPKISYIRVTRPESSDSLIAKAGQGATIAIIGENLQDARELWINDRQASLSPTFITNTTIITTVPSNIPTEITNKMKIIFANGDSLIHDFMVDINEPLISGMLSEYVNTGDIATITGDYFYEPLKVTFTGGVEGEVVTVEDDVIEVRVPEGAQPGPVTVTTNFGETESEFYFRDNRNIIAGFEETDFTGWWHGQQYIKASDDEIPNISNNFLRMNQSVGEWGWVEMWVGSGGTINQGTKNIPAEAFTSPEKYSLKFEINTLESLTGAELRMYMGPDMAGQRGDVYYTWKPNFNTEGQWQTVTIPWEDFWNANQQFAYNPNGYGVSFHFSGPLAFKAMFGLDNIRVVPNTIP